MRPLLDPADRLWPGPAANIDAEVHRIAAQRTSDPVLASPDPAQIADRLPGALPQAGAPMETVLEEIRTVVYAHARRNTHPGMFGYVCGSGLPTDPMAHAMAAALGQNVTGFPSAPGATTVERQLIRWLFELTGLSEGSAGGTLLGGGSAANSSGLAVALHHQRPREAGLRGGPAPVIYATGAAHFSIPRAVRLLGLGTDGLHLVDTDPAGRMDVDALRRAIVADRDAGKHPMAVSASAGATTTGVIDPLPDIADVCATEKVWLHADAAYGGGVLLHGGLRARLAGIERADSITLDLHKWLYTTFDCSAILYRDHRTAKRTFYETAEYVGIPEDARPDQFAFFHYGPETSRRFRALAPYLALRHYGIDRIGRNIAHNVACAEYLADRIADTAGVELAAPVGLSIACFRVVRPGLDASAVDRLNAAIQRQLLAEGQFYLSPTTLHGRPVLRVCVLSYETTADTMDALLARVLELADELKSSAAGG